VQLQWQTSSEQNSDHFDIQRSTDGSRFESIGQVRAAGNSVLPQQYRFTDALLPSIPTVFYRLDMIDKDGKHEYSRVVAVHLNKGGVELLIAPNPASKLLQVQTGNHLTGDAIIEILDINGKQWIKKQVSFQSGTNSNSINIEALPAASYLLKISSGSTIYVKQFIKQ
jgi:hypothetical protein